MSVNEEVTQFIDGLAQPWQVELCGRLRGMVREAVPDATERIQYRKPHFLRNGKYAAVISPAKDYVGFTIFNAASIDTPDALFEGPPERRTIKLRNGRPVDYDRLSALLAQASASL